MNSAQDPILKERMASLLQTSTPLPGSRPYDNYRPINIPARLDGRLLIDCVCDMYPQFDRNRWLAWFDEGHILCDGKPVPSGRSVRGGDQFRHCFPDTVEPDVDARIRLLWEDRCLVGLVKPAPLPVHPCGRFYRNTLTGLLDAVYGDGSLKLVHRLDANTTGVMVLARSKAVATNLRKQFESDAVEKRYLVRLIGQPERDRFVCETPIGRSPWSAGVRRDDPLGREARTDFRVLSRLSDGTCVAEATPRTGRTNQIRIHLWSLGMPVMGDPTYLPGRRLAASQTLPLGSPPMCLHAWSLSLQHPEQNERFTLSSGKPGSGKPGSDKPDWVRLE